MAVHQKHGTMQSEKITLWLKVGELVSQDQADEALKLLHHYLKPQNHPLLSEVWLLKRRQKLLKKDIIKGAISHQDARLEGNLVCSSILELAQMVNEEENST